MHPQRITKSHQKSRQQESSLFVKPALRSPKHPLLQLQRTIGNRAMGRVLQAKFTIGEPDDKYEQEADRVAEQVMRMPAPPMIRTGEEDENKLQRKSIVQRDVKNDPTGNPTDFEFRIGIELEQPFVQLAKQRALNGIISDRDLRLLHAHALKRRGTVNDHERKFMAGLLDAANVGKLQRTSISPATSITFSLASITSANIQHVIDLDRKALPASVAEPLREAGQDLSALRLGEAVLKLGEAEIAASREIMANAGSFKAQATALVSFAQGHGVFLNLVLKAMLAAASDNSAGDKVLAGIAYAIAASSQSSIADDLLSGKIKVDALIPGAFGRLPVPGGAIAFYITAAQGSGLKGDTIYLQTNIDLANLKERSDVVHELRHAEEDKAASPTARPSFPTKNMMELRGYRAQARYILAQIVTQPVADQQRSAHQAAAGGSLVLGALALEGQTDIPRFRHPLELIFGAAPAPFTQTPAQLTRLLANPAATIEAAVLQDIDASYNLKPGETGVVEGLAGESLIHWIFRI